MREVKLGDYRWGGMLSIWGQGRKATQGVCYSGLAYSPEDYIDIIEKDGPPVEKWLTRYVDLELANQWLDYCINHVFPEEVLKHITFQRVHSKGHWPSNFEYELDDEEMIDEYDTEDAEDEEEERERLRRLQRETYGGTTPWLRISFSQDLSANAIFCVGVLLRYASEHGPTLKMMDILPEFAPEVPVLSRINVASNIGGARGHGLGGWGYGYAESFPEVSRAFSWKERFLKMYKANKPFWEDPHKRGQVDDLFSPPWKNVEGRNCYAAGYACYRHERNGIVLTHGHNDLEALLNAWKKKGKK